MAGDFRRFSSIARSLTRISSFGASHFSTFCEFSHGLHFAEVQLRSRSRFGLQLRKFTSCSCPKAFPSSEFQLASTSLLSSAAVVEAKPIAAFEQLSHAP